jgi:hypothetical protein
MAFVSGATSALLVLVWFGALLFRRSTFLPEVGMANSIGRRGLLMTGMAAPLAILASGTPAQAAEGKASSGVPVVGPVADIGAGSAPVLAPAKVGTFATRTGVQFTGTLNAGQTKRWFTFGWPVEWHVIWHAMSRSPRNGVVQIEFSTAIERASFEHVTYYITIKNVSNEHVDVEGRFAVLNQG